MQIRKFIDRVNSLSMPAEHKNSLLIKIRKYLRGNHPDKLEASSSIKNKSNSIYKNTSTENMFDMGVKNERNNFKGFGISELYDNNDSIYKNRDEQSSNTRNRNYTYFSSRTTSQKIIINDKIISQSQQQQSLSLSSSSVCLDQILAKICLKTIKICSAKVLKQNNFQLGQQIILILHKTLSQISYSSAQTYDWKLVRLRIVLLRSQLVYAKIKYNNNNDNSNNNSNSNNVGDGLSEKQVKFMLRIPIFCKQLQKDSSYYQFYMKDYYSYIQILYICTIRSLTFKLSSSTNIHKKSNNPNISKMSINNNNNKSLLSYTAINNPVQSISLSLSYTQLQQILSQIKTTIKKCYICLSKQITQLNNILNNYDDINQQKCQQQNSNHHSNSNNNNTNNYNYKNSQFYNKSNNNDQILNDNSSSDRFVNNNNKIQDKKIFHILAEKCYSFVTLYAHQFAICWIQDQLKQQYIDNDQYRLGQSLHSIVTNTTTKQRYDQIRHSNSNSNSNSNCCSNSNNSSHNNINSLTNNRKYIKYKQQIYPKYQKYLNKSPIHVDNSQLQQLVYKIFYENEQTLYKNKSNKNNIGSRIISESNLSLKSSIPSIRVLSQVGVGVGGGGGGACGSYGRVGGDSYWDIYGEHGDNDYAYNDSDGDGEAVKRNNIEHQLQNNQHSVQESERKQQNQYSNSSDEININNQSSKSNKNANTNRKQHNSISKKQYPTIQQQACQYQQQLNQFEQPARIKRSLTMKYNNTYHDHIKTKTNVQNQLHKNTKRYSLNSSNNKQNYQNILKIKQNRPSILIRHQSYKSQQEQQQHHQNQQLKNNNNKQNSQSYRNMSQQQKNTSCKQSNTYKKQYQHQNSQQKRQKTKKKVTIMISSEKSQQNKQKQKYSNNDNKYKDSKYIMINRRTSLQKQKHTYKQVLAQIQTQTHKIKSNTRVITQNNRHRPSISIDPSNLSNFNINFNNNNNFHSNKDNKSNIKIPVSLVLSSSGSSIKNKQNQHIYDQTINNRSNNKKSNNDYSNERDNKHKLTIDQRLLASQNPQLNSQFNNNSVNNNKKKYNQQAQHQQHNNNNNNQKIGTNLCKFNIFRMAKSASRTSSSFYNHGNSGLLTQIKNSCNLNDILNNNNNSSNDKKRYSSQWNKNNKNMRIRVKSMINLNKKQTKYQQQSQQNQLNSQKYKKYVVVVPSLMCNYNASTNVK